MLTQPYLMAPTMHSMDVAWITSEATLGSRVEYGITEALGSSVPAAAHGITGLMTVDESGGYTVPLRVFRQLAHIPGLSPGTRYHYRVVDETVDGTECGPVYDFRTAPEPGGAFRFLILSDLQMMPRAVQSLGIAGKCGADFILYNGDMQNHPNRAGGWFNVPGTPERDDLRWFNMMQRTDDGCRLLQYAPIIPCPGNHEVTRQETVTDKAMAHRDKMDLSVYMQLFGSYYPDQGHGPDGNHWYSLDYGDLHIVSLSVFRWSSWPIREAPGWLLFDGIGHGSPQYEWLKADLESNRTAYTWVSQHWHMFNRGEENQCAYTDPVPSATEPGLMDYPPDEDYLMRDIKPLLERHGVDAVSYGHSHVYERYLIDGVHYIEAASISSCYRGKDDPPDPHGYPPVVEENGFRSFMVVAVNPETGMTAKGIQASDEGDGRGSLGRVFDEFTIATAR